MQNEKVKVKQKIVTLQKNIWINFSQILQENFKNILYLYTIYIHLH